MEGRGRARVRVVSSLVGNECHCGTNKEGSAVVRCGYGISYSISTLVSPSTAAAAASPNPPPGEPPAFHTHVNNSGNILTAASRCVSPFLADSASGSPPSAHRDPTYGRGVQDVMLYMRSCSGDRGLHGTREAARNDRRGTSLSFSMFR